MESRIKRALIATGVLAVLLLAYVAAGPYLAINGIRNALAERDAGALERHVDFPALRVNLKAHLEDYIVRQGGELAESGGLLGAIGLQVASGLGGVAVDAMVTPLGLGALLQGHATWKRATGQTVDGDAYGDPQPVDPLNDAQTRFESSSRFTATVTGTDGAPVVAVFQRQGLRWKLVDVRFDQPPG
jgi:hypothetical protein